MRLAAHALNALAFTTVILAAEAFAQPAYSPPRTPDGHPDFQGVWEVRFLTPMELIEGMPGPVVTREQAGEISKALREGAPELVDPDFDFYSLGELAEVKGSLRSSLIVEPANGQLPFTAEGLKRANEYDRLFFEGFDNPEERDNFERCLAGLLQAPIRPFPAPVPFQFVQTPHHVVIWGEDVEALRIVHIGAAPPPDAMRSLEGWSAGRWEGDTLVVTTTHLRANDPYRSRMMRSLIVGADSRVVERFTRVSDTELHYAFTIEDPAIYSQPWKGEFSFRPDPGGQVYEYACHEGNHSLNHMLLAGRAADGKDKKDR